MIRLLDDPDVVQQRLAYGQLDDITQPASRTSTTMFPPPPKVAPPIDSWCWNLYTRSFWTEDPLTPEEQEAIDEMRVSVAKYLEGGKTE